MQVGFQKGVGTRDQIFNLRLMLEKARESSVPLCIALLTIRKYSTVKYAKLWSVLKGMGMCETTFETLKSLYKDQL